MKEEITATINTITQFGLKSDLKISSKMELLERSLVKIYNFYFEVEHVYAETDYPDFTKFQLPYLRANVRNNFPEFGCYKIANDIINLDNIDDILTGDAIDDLSDIIIDLLITIFLIRLIFKRAKLLI